MDNEETIHVYKYWMPVYSEEHFLLLREITELWGLYSTTGKVKKPHTLLTTMILKKYSNDHNHPPVFYETRNGLKQVYSREAYEGAFKWFLEQTNYAMSGAFKIDNVNYKYTIGRPEPYGA